MNLTFSVMSGKLNYSSIAVHSTNQVASGLLYAHGLL